MGTNQPQIESSIDPSAPILVEKGLLYAERTNTLDKSLAAIIAERLNVVIRLSDYKAANGHLVESGEGVTQGVANSVKAKIKAMEEDIQYYDNQIKNFDAGEGIRQ